MVRRGAVPVLDARRDDDGVAGQEHLHRLAQRLIAADTGQHVEHLPHGMCVPVGAPARRKAYAGGAQSRRRLGGEHLLVQDETRVKLPAGALLVGRVAARMILARMVLSSSMLAVIGRSV